MRIAVEVVSIFIGIHYLTVAPVITVAPIIRLGDKFGLSSICEYGVWLLKNTVEMVSVECLLDGNKQKIKRLLDVTVGVDVA